ncbi:MAG TPA: subclass B3 metallo-beta-lactamase [Nitrospira sp.]|nr:subclass B3 metallo-beta-lactamase [Nitrospira sp.]
MTSWLLSLGIVVSVLQTATFKADPPHACDDCGAWSKAREPFKVYGNTYFVGTAGLSALLVTGDAGHVLLDAGLTQSAPLIDANIRKLGFKTEDVKLILVSHGHFDHAGGVHALQRHTGATVAASESTAQALNRGENTPDDPQFGFGKVFNGFPSVKTVKVIGDQEMLKIGTISIKAHLIPGHTPGSTAYTWQSCQDGKCLNMVYADSLTSPSAPGFKYGKRLESFRRSIEKVAALPCDIVLSPHPAFTQVDQKLKKRAELKGRGPDPFIDSNGCRAYAAAGMKLLEARIAEEAK